MLLVSVLAMSAGCGPDDGWDPDAQFAPSLRPAVGVRLTDGQLDIWLGRPCPGVTRVSVAFDTDGERAATFEARAADPGVRLEHIHPTGHNRGLHTTRRLPAGFDPAAADELRLTLGGVEAWGTTTDLDEVAAHSADNAADTYYFDQIGWLEPEQVAEQDGRSFLTPCTPDATR